MFFAIIMVLILLWIHPFENTDSVLNPHWTWDNNWNLFWNTAKKKYVAEYDEDYNGEDLDIGGMDIDRG